MRADLVEGANRTLLVAGLHGSEKVRDTTRRQKYQGRNLVELIKMINSAVPVGDGDYEHIIGQLMPPMKDVRDPWGEYCLLAPASLRFPVGFESGEIVLGDILTRWIKEGKLAESTISVIETTPEIHIAELGKKVLLMTQTGRWETDEPPYRYEELIADMPDIQPRANRVNDWILLLRRSE